MAVLVEAISVIVRADAILTHFPDGWDGFKAIVPNQTLCADGELARVGFMAFDDVESFIRELEDHRLRYLRAGEATDIVVGDQQRGLMVKCAWAEFGKIDWQGNETQKIAACRLSGSEIRQVVTPEGWTYNGSLSATFGFLPAGVRATMEVMSKEDGIDIVTTPLCDKPQYIARAETKRGSKRNEIFPKGWGGPE